MNQTATAEASSSAGNQDSRPLCEANSRLKSGIQRSQDLAKQGYGDKSQALVVGCHRYTGCPTGQRATENKNVVLILITHDKFRTYQNLKAKESGRHF